MSFMAKPQVLTSHRLAFHVLAEHTLKPQSQLQKRNLSRLENTPTERHSGLLCFTARRSCRSPQNVCCRRKQPLTDRFKFSGLDGLCLLDFFMFPNLAQTDGTM